jgi:hypothetical protein
MEKEVRFSMILNLKRRAAFEAKKDLYSIAMGQGKRQCYIVKVETDPSTKNDEAPCSMIYHDLP